MATPLIIGSVLVLILLFIFFVYLMLRRTAQGFKKGMDDSGGG
jgi:preprotein translocase subunit YajC